MSWNAPMAIASEPKPIHDKRRPRSMLDLGTKAQVRRIANAPNGTFTKNTHGQP